MSWLWGGKKGAADGLDNDLRKYLQEETEKRRQEEQERQAIHQRQNDAEAERTRVAEEAKNRPAPLVPAESQYQDGRYAHLWKTYQSQHDLIAATSTPQDQLTAVLGTFKDRKAAIGRAALENCIMEQMAEHECFSHGTWQQLSTMCRTESRAFNRCYEMQGRFLKALGYLTEPRSADEEERIQMHADKLYHQMLEREKNDPKSTKPLIPAEEVLKVLGEDSAWNEFRKRQAQNGSAPIQLSDFPKKRQQDIRQRLEGMTEAEREIEMQLLAAEYRADKDIVEQVARVYDQEAKDRAARRDAGTMTIGDRMKAAWWREGK